MLRTLRILRPLAVTATVAAVLALAPVGATPALAQASRFSAELTKIEIAEKRVTLKASMGQQTLRVAPGVALDALKPGDKVLITFGQDGTESIITSIEVIKS
jgi:Cu/Ag efflux protein CusF